ncbi:unnamed protein product [Cylindrotheca closterium]|uniref:Uncharacterized protein n=1 Tax=Cylindrotheca closterium TaxID=2856 RepID=A0AAD2CMN7_9STRA|nr:unnamed protein product [Cylindrotheca closterium]
MAEQEEEDSPPREISFLQQQQLFFRRAITHFTNPDLYLYTGQTRDQIPDDVLHVRVDPSVRVIDWDTFAGCGIMRTIELPYGLVRIMGRAFIDCYKLKEPVIPPTVKEIGDMAFSSCFAVNSLDLPEGLERIGRAAFPSCSFRNVKLPKTMNEVGGQSFSCCTDLISVEIPYGMTAIHSEAFFQCLELRNVAIPDTVNVIGDNAFECCFKLQDKFPEEESLIEVLKTRFDDLPLHKICYYHAYKSTEETLQELSQAMMDMGSFESAGEEHLETMRQDAFGMTALHILAMSKKQDLELYQLLLEAHPDDINVTDTWGYLPVYYACLCDAPPEVVQYLLDTHKQLSENAAEELSWKTIVDNFSIMFVAAHVLKCVIYWTVVDRLKQVHCQSWKVDIINAIDMIPDGGRKTWKEKDTQVAAVYDLLSLYELKEMTSLLELAAWKSKMDQNQGMKKYVKGAFDEMSDHEEVNTKGAYAKRLSIATHTTLTTHISSEPGSVSDRYSMSERGSITERESIVERGSIISKTVVEESPHQEEDKLETVEVQNDPDAIAIRNNCRINSGADLIVSNVIPFCLYPVQLQPWEETES